MNLIAVVLAAYFSLVATPVGVTSSFPLHGVDVVDNTVVAANLAKSPELFIVDETPAVAFSFVAPVSGECRVFQVLYDENGKPVAIVIAGREGIVKGTTQKGLAALHEPSDYPAGVTSHGYEVIVGCADPDNAKATAKYSNVYHIAIPGKPA